ncbi:CDP-archaeol synthase [Candidatus Gracilibacteria bacterium]|nr:CDP-archaeol synthase [Candidatus Gracilibacteria bacterium]
MNVILESLYLMLPVYIAEMSPVFASYLPWPATPVDNGASWRGKRILGDHKTYRGLIVGLIVAIVIVFIQHSLDHIAFFDAAGIIDYGALQLRQVTLIGLMLGGGAFVGDMIKSFFKRRVGIAPGKAWIPFDHIDSTIGALIAALFIVDLSCAHIIVILIANPLLHVLANVVGYMMKVRKTPL